MPLYEYQCQACGKRFEVIRKFSDEPLEVCRLCGKGPVDRLLSSPAIQFKGTGWYITDYSQKGKQSGGTVPPGSNASGDNKDAGSSGAKDDSASSSSTSTPAPAAPAAAKTDTSS